MAKKKGVAVDREAVRAIRDFAKTLPRKDAINAIRGAIVDIVELAEYNANMGKYGTAAGNYELAAYACSVAPFSYLSIRKNARKYAGKSKEMRKKSRTKTPALEDAVSQPIFLVVGVVSFLLALGFFLPTITGNVIVESGSRSLNYVGLVFLIVGILSIFKYSRKG